MQRYRLRIEQDTDPENPREWDNLGTLITWERDRHSPDPNPYPAPDDFADEMQGILAAGGAVLPVYRYSHSGDDYSTAPFSCPWDSGQVGWIYAEASARTETPDLEACLRGEVETFAQWARGDVWGYVVESETGKVVESCWGFFGRGEAVSNGHAAIRSLGEQAEARERDALAFINTHCAA